MRQSCVTNLNSFKLASIEDYHFIAASHSFNDREEDQSHTMNAPTQAHPNSKVGPFACLNCGVSQNLPAPTGTFTCPHCQAKDGTGKVFETRRTVPTWHNTR